MDTTTQLVKVSLGESDYNLLESIGYLDNFKIKPLSKEQIKYYMRHVNINSFDIMVDTITGNASEDSIS
jgi:tRNA(Glu) U13 pseudouridine synthase TruD